MKKLLTLALIMLMALSVVLVSCNNDPNANKTDDSQNYTKAESISDDQMKTLEDRYSGLTSTLNSVGELTAIKEDPSYSEQHDITITPTANNAEGFTLLSEDDISKYNKIVDPTLQSASAMATIDNETSGNEEGGMGEVLPTTTSEKIEKAVKYASFGFDVSFANKPMTDADSPYVFTKTGLSLKIKLNGEENFVNYDGSTTISDTALMKEYQALLKIQEKEGNNLTMDSFIVKKLLSLVSTYKPEIKIDTTFGTDKQGKFEADVIISIEKNGVIDVNVKSVEVTYKTKVLFTLKDALFKVTLGNDFNVSAKLSADVSADSEPELYINFEEISFKGGVSVSFEDVKINLPVSESTVTELNVIAKGNGGYNFTTGEINADLELSDMTTLYGKTISFLTVECEYKGKSSDFNGLEEKESYEKFLDGFSVKKFVIMSMYSVDTSYVNKLIKDNKDKIYNAVQNYLFPEDKTIAPSDANVK